jgi:hypothetical protein
MAARAGQAVGVQPLNELGIACRFIPQVGDRKVHMAAVRGVRLTSPQYPRLGPGWELPSHHLAYLSQSPVTSRRRLGVPNCAVSAGGIRRLGLFISGLLTWVVEPQASR